MNEVPRRIDILRQHPAEAAIRRAMRAVESMPAHEDLTRAVVALQQSLENVAAYVDSRPEGEWSWHDGAEAWCTRCGDRFGADRLKDASACPGCGAKGVPCAPAQDVSVEVNWHELRILAIWAENWARQIKKDSPDAEQVIAAVAYRLQRQYPDFTPLTLSAELADLPRAAQATGISIGPVETNVPKPPLVEARGPGAVGHARR